MAEPTRQLALEKELKQLTAINKTVATLIATIQVTLADILKTNQTTHHTDKLLDKWIKILSQTHFTQRIILKPHWTGTSGISDEELESKIQEERTLLNSLEEMEAENELLEQRIKSKESHEAQEVQRKRENINKRHRDLGLGPRTKLTTRDRRR